jgi:hypothetical protein
MPLGGLKPAFENRPVIAALNALPPKALRHPKIKTSK